MYRILITTTQFANKSTLKYFLGKGEKSPLTLEVTSQLSTALDQLNHDDIDAILLDLPTSQRLGGNRFEQLFEQLFESLSHTPILTVSHTESTPPTASEESDARIETVVSDTRMQLAQALGTVVQHTTIEEAYYKEKARAEIALNSISDAVICTDLNGNIDYLNIAAESMTGWARGQAHGHPIAEVFHIINGQTRQPDQDPIELVLKQDRPGAINANTLLITREGNEIPIEDSVSPIHDWDGKLTGVVIVFHDISAAKEMREKMTHLAHHDFLTNLPNRVLLNDRIAQAISLARRRGMQLAILFLDLDNFKHINDSLGHATGDILLQSVAQRLVSCVRHSDTVSRLGGDEFVILLAESKGENDAALTAEKMVTALSFPHQVGEGELYVSASIGISIYPSDGTDADMLIQCADTAMYHAKERGRNNYQFFRNEMNARAIERQSIEANLRRAMERRELVLHYQPQVNLETGRITGAEALLRWQHAEFGLVHPERFLPIAEECGLIVPIGQWVLREACTQAQQWSNAGLEPISIAVNISALEFRQKEFFDGVRDILQETGLPPSRLELEITESALMRNAESSAATLHALKEVGVRLAVDDFGTGYSSLSYLQQFPIDILKIDQSFVQHIESSSDEGVIVSAVISMGNSLKLRVIAEGVESATQLAFLKEKHCEEGQGFLFSQPVTAESFQALLAASHSPALAH